MIAVSVYGRLSDRINKFDITNIDTVCKEIEELVVQALQSIRPPDFLFDFCLKLFDRVFGENTTLCEPQPAWVRSPLGGGWLKKLTQICQEQQSMQRTDNPQSSSGPIRITSKLVSILGYGSELQGILRNSNKAYETKLSLLPIKARLCILRHPAYNSIQSSNQSIYFESLKHPLPLQRSARDDVTLTLDSSEYFLVCLLRYPTTDTDAQGGSRLSSLATVSNVTHPLTQQSAAQKSAIGVLRSHGSKEWLKTSPYLVLLDDFLSAVALTPRGGGGQSPGLAGGSQLSLSLNSDLKYHSKNGKLLICLACEYWMDTATIVRHHSEYSKYVSAQSKNQNRLTSGFDRTLPTDVIMLDDSGSKWTITSMQASYLLVQKLLQEPFLLKQYEIISMRNMSPPGGQKHSPRGLLHKSLEGEGAGITLIACPPCVDMIQQPLFDMLRCIFARGDEPSFSLGSSCVTYSLAVELWLLYLQPWKLQQPSASCTAASSSSGERSQSLGGKAVPASSKISSGQYSIQWKPYVAANLHFYTTLLACFLRATARVDLTPSTVEGGTQYKNLEMVLEVFSNQELVTTVENLVYDFLTWYPSQSRVGGRHEEDHPVAGKTSICGSSTEAELTSVKAQHHILFPDACIDQLDYFGIVDIRVSSKNDGLLLAQTLLRMKGEYDKVKNTSILSKFEKNVFGGSLSHIVASIDNVLDPLIASFSGSENDLKESKAYCERLIASATVVCYLIDIVMPSLPTDSISVSGSLNVNGAPLVKGRGDFVGEDPSSDSSTLLRNEYNGKLTRLGKASLLNGDMKCRKEDIRSTRDPLDLPICSYEWPELTRLMVRLSKYLNLKHDLPADKQTVNW
eukprot:CAMPEP_0119045096 /NCGR_PEP_ID=MMETSP1177-20130426/36931_1 /TAXON_ID=2985 /ORGANISM="Ochromonas sp, Strain CCMP1899" /LENGTH=850 /DNA_ID=CAMNT_0007016243 /DNA_START=41 /DNA_END=2590 /DNA_ORIENTATION=-